MPIKYVPWLIYAIFGLSVQLALGNIGGFVNGQVLNGKSRSPIIGAKIILYINPPFTSSGSELPVPVDTGYSDSSGAYIFENLGPDIDYRMVANAPGFRSAGQNFMLHHSPEAYIDFLLEEMQTPSGVIEGVVHNSKTFEPISGLKMSLVSTAPKPPVSEQSSPPPPVNLLQTVFTDVEGRYQFSGLRSTNFQNIYSIIAGKDTLNFIELMEGEKLILDISLNPEDILILSEFSQKTLFYLDRSSLERGEIKISGPDSGYLVRLFNLRGQIQFSQVSEGKFFKLSLSPRLRGKGWVLSLKTKNGQFSQIFSF